MDNLIITYVKCPEDKYGIKCPYEMKPEYITVHNTYNDASAMNEISYMLRNNYTTSFHFAVDYERAVQGLPLNRNSWNAGDGGNGTGNRKTISIEICYSKSGGANFTKSEQNAAILVAKLLKQYGWGIEKVKKHQDWSGKYCPHRTLDLGWDRFLNLVKAQLGETKKEEPAATPALAHKVGETVTINGVYTSSNSTTKLQPAITKGKITHVYNGAKNPYLLEGGNIGFVNDACIVSNTKAPAKAPAATKPVTPTGTTKYSKGQKVQFTTCYTSSTNDANCRNPIPVAKMARNNGTITHIYIVNGKSTYLLDSGLCFVNDGDISKVLTASTSTAATSSPIKVGDKVAVKAGAKDWNGNSAGGVKRNSKCYRVDELIGKRAVIDITGVCTAFHVDNLYK